MAIGKAKPKTGRKDNMRLEEVVKLLEFAPDEITPFRLIGDQILSIKRHWIKIYAGKEKKVIKIPRYCLKHNPLNEDEPHDVHCPYCELSHGGGDSNATASYEFFYLMNAIDREEQENEPAKKSDPTKSEAKTGFKDPNSKTWTPVKVVRIPSSVASRIQELKDLNKAKNKKTGKTATYDLDHPKYGCDVMLRYKPKASGTDKYSVDKGDRTPITDEEKEFLTYNLSPELLTLTGLLSEKEAAEDFKRNEYVGGDETDEDDDDEDSYSLGKGKKKKKGDKKKSKSRDDDEDDDDDDDDEDEDEKPSKKKKSKVKSKKKSKSRDDDDDDDDDDDEDEKPAKKKKSSKDKKSSKSEKSSKKSKDGDKKKKKKKDVPF